MRVPQWVLQWLPCLRRCGTADVERVSHAVRVPEKTMDLAKGPMTSRARDKKQSRAPSAIIRMRHGHSRVMPFLCMLKLHRSLL